MTTTNPETLFPPRPGGMVERARQQKSQDAAQQQQQQSARPQTTPKVKHTPVRVNAKTPDAAAFRTVVVSTSGVATQRLCGYNANRKRVLVYTLDEPVVIGQLAQMSDASNAGNAAGLPCSGAALPIAPVFLPIESCAEIWVTATSSTATRVVAVEELYADTTT